MYHYRFLKEAEQGLRHEVAHSKKHYGLEHAKRYKKGLMDAVKLICLNPMNYQEREDICEDVRLCVYKGTKIVYTVDVPQKMVIIVAVIGTSKSISAREMKLHGPRPVVS